MRLSYYRHESKMRTIQNYTDKMAISLSLLCAIHCLAFPVVILLLPTVAALQLNDEAFHLWMLLAVIPTSLYALTMGCKQHKQYRLLIVGFMGLLFLVSAVVLGGVWEKVLTCIGAGIMAFGHYQNYRLCQHEDNCECHAPDQDT